MTNEQINIAIAKHLGWRFAGDPELDAYMAGWVSQGRWAAKPGVDLSKLRRDHPEYQPGLVFIHAIPNFAEDLNAMFEAEESLGDDLDQWALYDRYLAEGQVKYTWHATPLHRAEAFLRVIGGWIE